ncbi:hypothetical protein [Brevundimonas lutea]|uniref:hypothetical protein n=1 Tax=Brevundimonas lutea TaxID=2293980 RepID=UPI000F0147A2|nr:hypothetical protein [Brevundimonas lutea]
MTSLTALAAAIALLDPAAACDFDRDAMLAMDEQTFDQTPEGWRSLHGEGCIDQAAQLIADYRAHTGSEGHMLYWHEGQLRAEQGQSDAAIALLDQARQPALDFQGWDHYVDASIAFLNQDRSALEAARERLAATPTPDMEMIATLPDGRRVRVPWPPNLNVVDGFVRCFDEPYAVAYRAPCREQVAFEPVEE